MGSSPPGSSVYGTSQPRILEWVAIPFSRGSSQPRDQIQVSCIAGRFFTIWATGEALIHNKIPICLQGRSWRKQHPILSVHIISVEHWGGENDPHKKKSLKKKVKQNQVNKKLKPLYQSLIMPSILILASPCYILSYSSICQLASDFTSREEVCSHLWLQLFSPALSPPPAPLSAAPVGPDPSTRWDPMMSLFLEVEADTLTWSILPPLYRSDSVRRS